jgi:hypothetical protein
VASSKKGLVDLFTTDINLLAPFNVEIPEEFQVIGYMGSETGISNWLCIYRIARDVCAYLCLVHKKLVSMGSGGELKSQVDAMAVSS